jgi:hypothetical protein
MGRTLLDDPAVAQGDDSVGALTECRVVRREQDGEPLLRARHLPAGKLARQVAGAVSQPHRVQNLERTAAVDPLLACRSA